jgi:hypothetical protein
MEGDQLSKTEWEAFSKGTIWASFLFDLEEREKYLFQLFRDGDEVWNPDVIKGKLTEIEFFKQIPGLIISSIIIKEDNKNNKERHDAEKDWNAENL